MTDSYDFDINNCLFEDNISKDNGSGLSIFHSQAISLKNS